MYFEVTITEDGRAMSYVRKETLLALYIRANDEKEAKAKLVQFKHLFPHPTCEAPRKMWAISGWTVFMACPEMHDVVWQVYRWERDTVSFCSVSITDVTADEIAGI